MYKSQLSLNKLKNKLLYLILKKWLQILNLIVNRNLSSIDTNYVTYLLNSGVIPSTNEKFFDWDKTWKKAMFEWNEGRYQNSVTIRKELMYEIYLANKINFKDYYPPFLSRIFAGPIGHNGVIGMHIGAQKFGLIPKGKRWLPVNNLMANRPFFLSTKEYINLVSFQNQSSGDELPSQWHVYERLQLIKTEEGFVDLYPLIEKVFSHIEDFTKTPILKLDYEYEKNAKFELKKLGLDNNDWFVTLHVRDTGLEGETREQPVESYLKSIYYILSHGGKIIRIGDEFMKKLPSIPGVIDLTKNFAVNSKLNLFALARAKFFIGTNSGPKFMPPLYGVPSLITNLTSIGLESLSLTSKTIYIPKAIICNNDSVSLSDTLNSHMGFNNFTAKELNKRNIELKCNTEDDILNGVKEMIDIVFNNFSARELGLDNKVKEIRENVQFSSKGNFSTSWLRQNESWFLNSN
jgi:putative glycosyltransferase (TIGR04372 family)